MTGNGQPACVRGFGIWLLLAVGVHVSKKRTSKQHKVALMVEKQASRISENSDQVT